MMRGTILLAEDTKEVRCLMGVVLRGGGYRVLEATDGVDALDIATHYAGFIDLLVTDVQMPRLDGAALSRRLREARPGLKVLFVSGSAAEAPVGGAPLLAKPFTAYTLLRVTERLLGAVPSVSEVGCL